MTPLRSVRVPSELWDTAVSKARQEGTTVTAVMLAALEAFNATEGQNMRDELWNSTDENVHAVMVTAGRVQHLTSEAAYAECRAAIGQREITDACAATIASWWQGPGRDSMPFTLLAQGSPVAYVKLRDAIMREYRNASGRDRDALDMLGTWTLNGSDPE